MINHARTLLLNSKENDDPAPWERYSPQEYVPLELPSYLESIRKLLVGTDSWWDRTYRVELLLTMMESPRYEGKYSWMDFRMTPPQVVPFLYQEDPVTVSRVASLNPDVYVTYLSKSFDGVLPIKRTWQVLGAGGTGFTVKTDGQGRTIQAYYSAANNGWVLPIASDFDLLFSGAGAVDDIWNVRAYKKPVNTFAQYPAIVNSLSSAWTYQLFSTYSPSEEPIKEYSRWYKTCVHAEDRIAAVVLAYLLKATMLL